MSFALFKYLFIILLCLFKADLYAQDYSNAESINIYSLEQAAQSVKENYEFYGLATYLNNVSIYLVSKDGVVKFDINDPVALENSQWLAVVGRFKVLASKIEGAGSSGKNDQQSILTEAIEAFNGSPEVISKSAVASVSAELDQLRYMHLWTPFAWLARGVEALLLFIQAHLFTNWGVAVIFLCVVIKLALLPISILTTRFQRKISQVQAQLAPKLSEIKAHYDGEQAHNRIMAAHKELGVSPFYTLKPMLGLFIQIPVLIAVFNALGEMPQLDGQPFLWIKNLAYPDMIAKLSFGIPMFGNIVSVLPFVMTIATVFSTYIFTNSYASDIEIRRQKRNLVLMAGAFFILFYPFPAAMVLYWTASNILHIAQQQVIKI